MEILLTFKFDFNDRFMKILHTSDWHLGHKIYNQSQQEEQILFLKWLEEYIITHKVDVLLVAGDIFDSGSPSNQSLEMYYSFLVKLTMTTCKSIIITGGNHDSPGTLNAPKHILNALSIQVVGKAPENINEEVFEICINKECIIIGAVPYLRDQDIRKALAGESFDELNDRYKKALINHYTELATYCKSINKKNVPVIATGHLFAIGGSVSDSEQNIYVGSLGHIGANDFPAYFDYIALGHLHRSQLVANNPKIRYSGSPFILGFSELNYEKKVIIITVENNNISKIEDAIVPRFREFYKITGTKEEVINQFPILSSNSYQLTPFVEIILDKEAVLIYDDIKKNAEDYAFNILKTTIKNQRKTEGIEELLRNTKSIKELQPEDVFKLKCTKQGFDLAKNPQIQDAFNEILQKIKEQ